MILSAEDIQSVKFAQENLGRISASVRSIISCMLLLLYQKRNILSTWRAVIFTVKFGIVRLV
jgi:hypothetical protein